MRARLKVGVHPSLHAMVDQAIAADPRDIVLCPVGEHVYATLFGVIPDVLAVLRSAARIEHDHHRLLEWYVQQSIACLDNFTASELVRLGRAELVIDFLEAIDDNGNFSRQGLGGVAVEAGASAGFPDKSAGPE
jgi:hypothetical protein